MSPIVGVLVLLAITVCLAAVVAAGAATMTLEAGGPTAAFDLQADGETGAVAIEHVAGDSIDVTELSVTVAVEGTALRDQPPVPFVGADGFDGTPTGPFNEATEPVWHAGERAAVTVAETNEPTPESGETVSVRLVVDGQQVAALETTAT
ncbi:type IV pilin [Salinadaptatus halalkaliphilus]|uniref:Type IV pilin n=1 Tax=Salinadaptatus halalkaliphilus TaxID=2419781 RepID=A0A4S3TMT2_9EURY|nr:type IV pilin [Salinadaptatus halalkaliphilus]